MRGLIRPRNLALVLVPAAVMAACALGLQGRVEARIADGAMAVAIVPAPLVAPGLVGRMRGRGDLAGALVLGTVLLAFLLLAARGGLAGGALAGAVQAYSLAAMFANALPTVRDALLGPIRAMGWCAAALVFAAAVAAPPVIDAATIGVAVAMAVAGLTAAATVAALARRDVLAAVGGAGLRDPVLGVALASVAFGPAATGVPLVYAALIAALAAVALRAR